MHTHKHAHTHTHTHKGLERLLWRYGLAKEASIAHSIQTQSTLTSLGTNGLKKQSIILRREKVILPSVEGTI